MCILLWQKMLAGGGAYMFIPVFVTMAHCQGWGSFCMRKKMNHTLTVWKWVKWAFTQFGCQKTKAVDGVFLPQKFIDKIIMFLLRCWTETRVRWRCCHPISVCCTPGTSRQQNAPSCGMCTAARNPATQHSSTRYSGHSQCCWGFHMLLPLRATVDAVMKVGVVLILYDAPRPV